MGAGKEPQPPPAQAFWASCERCGNLRLGLLSVLHGTGLQEVRKLWQGRVFMRWLLHGEDLRGPSLLKGLERGEHPWEGSSSANGLFRTSGLLWPRQTEQGLKLTMVALRSAHGQELVLHCIQHTLWSSQLEHTVLENSASESQSLQGPHSCAAASSRGKVGQERPGGSLDVVPSQLGRK